MAGRGCGLAVTFVALGLSIGAHPAYSQTGQVAARTARSDAHRVTIHADNALLSATLENVARQAGLTLMYQGSVVTPTARVTVHFDSMPVATAFASVLRGTGAVAVLSAGERAVIVPVDETTKAVAPTLVGKVVNTVTKEGVAQAAVTVQGPLPSQAVVASIRSDLSGVFIVPNLKPGKYLVVVRKLAMSVAQREVTVGTNENQVVKFEIGLTPAARQLETVVATGSGERARREVGNWVTSINADSIVKTEPIRNLSDLLNGRAPGMIVQQTSGTVGSGSRIRIRGLSSLLTNEDPIVIVDGVRIDAAYSQSGFGPGAPTGASSTLLAPPGGNQAVPNGVSVPSTSRLNDIDPESIESIDILRGPAASTLYGSDAANGVIVIRTKHGTPGRTRASFTAERGQSSMDARFPDAYNGWGSGFGNVPVSNCTLLKVATRQCTQDSLSHFNPLNTSATSPFTDGRSSRYSAQVSGGVDRLQYFLSGTYNDDIGMLHFPSSIAEATLAQLNGVPLPSWAKRPNTLRQLGVSNTLTTQNGTLFDLSLATHVTHVKQTNAPDGYDGIVSSSVNSLGYRDTLTSGWGALSPVANFLTRYTDDVDRLSSSVTTHLRPTQYLSANASFGVDYSTRDDQGLLRQDLVLPNISFNSMKNIDNRSILLRNGNLGGTLEWPVRSNVRLRTSVGGQYTGSKISSVTTNAQGLTAGSESVNGASYLYTYEFQSEWVTAGWYVEETFALNDRLFLTTALRRDASSSFGQGAKPVGYPKFSASWLVSEEPFFPQIPGVSSLRLRAAFGQAGSQPEVSSRFLTYLVPLQAVTTLPTYVVNTIGNPDLLPERSQEFEGGLDINFAGDRVVLEGTFYNKSTRDALVTRQLPSSVGIATQVQNIGKLSNRGTEIMATVRPIMTPLFDWQTTFGYAKNTNKVVRLGTAAQTNGQYGRYVEGYPVDGVWARAIVTSQDANGNGIIEPSEIRLTDSAVYAGSGAPSSTFDWHNTVSLWSGRVRIGSAVSYRGDLTQVNGLLLRQCQQSRCRGAVDPTSSLQLQTLAVVGSSGSVSPGTVWPYLETTSAVRFDELSVTVTVPSVLVRQLRSRSASISLLGRNLGLWTRYRGADPMVNGPNSVGTTGGDQFADFGGTPQPREWSLRINLAY